MTEEQTLAVLRAAERVIQVAYRWLPYASDLVDAPESTKQNRFQDDLTLSRDAELLHKHLDAAEEAVLNIAETRGSKP